MSSSTGVEGWVEAGEAMERLRVRPQTLYAYVSRGRIAAESNPRDPRRSLYRAADIAELVLRKSRGRKASEIAEGAIAWGEPILDSAITTIADGRLFYRGEDAIGLAESETFEGVARLLRGGVGVAAPWTVRPIPPTTEHPRGRVFLALAARAAIAPPLAEAADEAATLLDIVADAVVGAAQSGAIHERLGRAWGCGRAGADLIRRALVLLADHELNASTFAARVAASAGASLAAAALAGLAVLSGSRHGGVADEVAVLALDADRLGPREAVAARLAFRPSAPGVGHPLYPAGDPRARALLGGFTPSAPLGHLAEALEGATGEKANVDFALAALAEALALPPDAPFCLFAVARCAGWTAHAMEQAAGGGVIRPRARYSGRPPSDGRRASSDPRRRRAG